MSAGATANVPSTAAAASANIVFVTKISFNESICECGLEVVFHLRAVVAEEREAAVRRDVCDLARSVAVAEHKPFVRARTHTAGKVLRVGVDLGEQLRAEPVTVLEV